MSLIAVVLIAACLASSDDEHARAEVAAQSDAAEQTEIARLIEAALWQRVEFFDGETYVPLPTAVARNALDALQEKFPDEPQIYLNQARLDEQLSRPALAEAELLRYAALLHDSPEALETLAAFYDRQAQFDKEAAILRRILISKTGAQTSPPLTPYARREILRRLLQLAGTHGLEQYRTPEFYRTLAETDNPTFEVCVELVEELIADKNYTEALRLLRSLRERFAARRSELLDKEVTLLDLMGNPREAEAVYSMAFDPFWSDERSETFYQFLRDHDRFRAYQAELRAELRRDPTDFDAGVRLTHLMMHAYEDASDILPRIEAARAARHVAWQADELAIAARLMLALGEGDRAARFLYTLSASGGFQLGSPTRAAVLYQLFEIAMDARGERLALTKGDLSFYKDVAAFDTHPGMLGGVLSLIFSDARIGDKYEQADERAVKHFNRAAAYRIFALYKEENPTSPQLAQMYLDIVRLYTESKDLDAARATLAEFESRVYSELQNESRGGQGEIERRYTQVALKLADAYVALGRGEDERKLYGRLLNRFSSEHAPPDSLTPDDRIASDSELTAVAPAPPDYRQASNPGITVAGFPPLATTRSGYSYYYSNEGTYHDYLKTSDASFTNHATYPDVLSRYVSSLAREERTGEILALYSAEIKKHPREEWLYEELLQWLGQTNLVEEQQRVYRDALKEFPTISWRDRLARWLLRRKRQTEFEVYSREVISRLNYEEVENYLTSFVSAGASVTAKEFDRRLYEGLYNLAHERFPHNMAFVKGLLRFHRAHADRRAWRALAARYYFQSPEIRDEFLRDLASRNELRAYLERARDINAKIAETNDPTSSEANTSASNLVAYKLFRADAAVWLSNYEEAIDAYRELNRLYPNTPAYAGRLIAFTRSFGTINRRFLEEAATLATERADALPSSAAYRTTAGEIAAELGDFWRARGEWEQLLALGSNDAPTYLDAATVYWDYFQYADALRVINLLRERRRDATLYAYQTGALLEAEHKLPQALAEYVKALDERDESYSQTKRRLKVLYARPQVPTLLRRAFDGERSRRATAKRERDETNATSSLILGYARFLKDAGARPAALTLLKTEIGASRDENFLEEARTFFEDEDALDRSGEMLALRGLTSAARTPRRLISYRLQLAERLRRTGGRVSALAEMRNLVHEFPTNYGVLSEAADFHWHTDDRAGALRLLRAGMTRGRGRFHYIFARKLAKRETEMGDFTSATRTLEGLHAADPANRAVFRDLAHLYVRNRSAAKLDAAFRRTLDATAQASPDPKELRLDIAALREEMIDAFTRLGDFAAAMDQHIEIINRNPGDEATIERALVYAARYGGADRLLAYYLRTSEQAYKDYRWSIVLARIYESKKDYDRAMQSYEAAIANQPEMPELYDRLARLEAQANRIDAAIAHLEKACELTNDDPAYVLRLAATLEQGGRRREAAHARTRLPQTTDPAPATAADMFARAAGAHDGEDLAEAYRRAFEAFAAAPLRHDLKSSEIIGYVHAVHDTETLDHIAHRLFVVRDKLGAETARANSTNAGKARQVMRTLDGALPEAIGSIAAEYATGDELTALTSEINALVADALQDDETGDDARAKTLALCESIAAHSHLPALEERILLARKDAARRIGDATLYDVHLRRLISLYTARGDFRRVVEFLQAERAVDKSDAGYDYLPVIAANARLVGDRDAELTALREYYRHEARKRRTELLMKSLDANVERYFEILLERGDAGRSELMQRARDGSVFQLQLINFLLAHRESDLAHEAIAEARMPELWRLARHAETSLALDESDAPRERYFTGALGVAPIANIGEMLAAKDNRAPHLDGDEWFRLAQTYGRWLQRASRDDARERAAKWLPAIIERNPRAGDKQIELARVYLNARDAQQALDHIRLARELGGEGKHLDVLEGEALMLDGEGRKAEQVWQRIIAADESSVSDFELYLQTLAAHGLSRTAREHLQPLVSARLKMMDGDADIYDPAARGEREVMQSFVRRLAASFDSSRERAAFLYQLCEAAPENVWLPAMIVDESLIAGGEHGDEQGDVREAFLRLLVKRASSLSEYDYDYNYTALVGTAWDEQEAEAQLDANQDFEIEEPDDERTKRQHQLLDLLIVRGRDREAGAVVQTIETGLRRRYARPAWLRLAKVRLEVRAGHLDAALASLKQFVGITNVAKTGSVPVPNPARLTDAARMLRDESRFTEAIDLEMVAYARRLALEQFEPTTFTALARLAHARGDSDSALKLMRIMVALSDADGEIVKATAAAELAALPVINSTKPTDAQAALPPAYNDLTREKALSIAAALAAELGHPDDAINFRQLLRRLAPLDAVNRLELARLLMMRADTDAALDMIAETIADRRIMRRTRWQAAWLAREVAGSDEVLWRKLIARVERSNIADRELKRTLDTFALLAAGHADGAIARLRELIAAMPSAEIEFVYALMCRDNNRFDEALKSFARLNSLAPDAAAALAASFDEDAPQRQVIRLYALADRPRAALNLAAKDAELKIDAATGNDEAARAVDVATRDEDGALHDVGGYQTLATRRESRSTESRAELLALLSRAAEQIGDLKSAVAFERARIEAVNTEQVRRDDESRLDALAARQTAMPISTTPLVVDERLLSSN